MRKKNSSLAAAISWDFDCIKFVVFNERVKAWKGEFLQHRWTIRCASISPSRFSVLLFFLARRSHNYENLKNQLWIIVIDKEKDGFLFFLSGTVQRLGRGQIWDCDQRASTIRFEEGNTAGNELQSKRKCSHIRCSCTQTLARRPASITESQQAVAPAGRA